MARLPQAAGNQSTGAEKENTEGAEDPANCLTRIRCVGEADPLNGILPTRFERTLLTAHGHGGTF